MCLLQKTLLESFQIFSWWQMAWEGMVKAISTPKSIVVYTTAVNACIFPKRDLGDGKMKVIEMISTHMPPKKVKIRG